jgi:hypothetical protein
VITEDRDAHRAFVATLSSNAVWRDYSDEHAALTWWGAPHWDAAPA